MSGYFPQTYLVDFLRFLRRHEEVFEVHTYDDLPWGDDFDHEHAYPGEYARWQAGLGAGLWDPAKVHLLLQYDVDSWPERTLALLRAQEATGIAANVMIFNRRVDRQHLEATGEARATEYPIDPAFLSHLERERGFVIGYHSNALERAGFDPVLAQQVFEADVEELRRGFLIRFFSPHGGAPGPNGLSNTALDVPTSLRTSIRWVHNRFSARFANVYSDGGLSATTVAPKHRDLRRFIRGCRPGGRYRVLLHPQYYDDRWEPIASLAGASWYQEVLAAYGASKARDIWRDVDLPPAHDFDRLRTLSARRHVVVWGAGSLGRIALGILARAAIPIHSLTDGNPGLVGTSVAGLTVTPSASLLGAHADERPFVVLASEKHAEMARLLEDGGWSYAADFAPFSDFVCDRRAS